MQFDYDADHESATYRGFTVKALRDLSPSNPFSDWDCEPPLAVFYDGTLTEYDDSGRMLAPLDGVSDSWINRRWREVAKALDVDVTEMISDVADRERGYPIADARRDYLENALSEAAPSRWGGNGGDYFDAIAAIWKMRGVEAESGCSTGYCQGDYADCLAVAVPAWAKKVGAPRASHKSQLSYAIKLYGYWAWGDVYGYEVVSPDGEDLDSCWGYYGGDHDESGLSDAAKGAIDWIIADASKRRAAKLKELIRARVPVALRPALLADASAYRGSM